MYMWFVVERRGMNVGGLLSDVKVSGWFLAGMDPSGIVNEY
jgi:hypothetical protein